MKTLVFGFAFAFIASQASGDSTILDQSVQLYGGYAEVFGNCCQAQSFTVGITGDLVRVEIPLFPEAVEGRIDLSIVRSYGGKPSILPQDLLVTVSAQIPDASYEALD